MDIIYMYEYNTPEYMEKVHNSTLDPQFLPSITFTC